MFVVIEGIDGCGKGTQVERASGYLRHQFTRCSSLRYPDRETPVGKIIDAYLKGTHRLMRVGIEECSVTDANNALMMQGLQWANRLERQGHLRKLLSRGHVVSDRYTASGVAYGVADGLDMEYLIGVNRQLEQPDLTVILDVPVEESWKRRPERAEAYEADPERLRVAREVYLGLAARFPTEYLVIDGCQHKDVIAVQIRDAIDHLFGEGL